MYQQNVRYVPTVAYHVLTMIIISCAIFMHHGISMVLQGINIVHVPENHGSTMVLFVGVKIKIKTLISGCIIKRLK